MVNQELLKQIIESTKEQENAIQNKSSQISTLYITHRNAFIEGQSEAKETEWSKNKSLTLNELSVIYHFMLSSSFLSAWFNLEGKKNNRNKMANSCSLLLSGTMNSEPELILKKFIEYENLWEKVLKREGIAPTSNLKIGLIISLIILGIALIFIFLF